MLNNKQYSLCVLLVLIGTIHTLVGRHILRKWDRADSRFRREAGRNLSKLILGTNKTKTRILTHFSSPRVGIQFGEHPEQDIVFPDAYDNNFEPIPKIDGAPKCASDLTFCETYNTYPLHHLKDILKNSEVDSDLFGVDEAPIELKNRIGQDDDMFVCTANSRIIYPTIGKNKNNKWKFIINQGEEDGYVQGIQIETCARPELPCDVIGEVPNGYTTACKQKYVYRRLMSLAENGRPKPDTFQLPSACCCSYKRNLEFLTRFRSPLITPAPGKID